MKTNKIHNIDALEGLKQLDDNSIDCVMTSPPYWALRDYGIEGQLGLEPTFDEYINKLCNIFDEVKRVLKKEGTCWVNLGDTYAGGNLSIGIPNDWDSLSTSNREKYDNKKFNEFIKQRNKLNPLPQKCLTLIPFRFAIEMINRGWILRNTIIWHKPNCMPSSVKDRFTVDFEYVFFFVKQKKYFFEAQYVPTIEPYSEKRAIRPETSKMKADYIDGGKAGNFTYNKLQPQGRNKRTVWSICPQPFPEAHFAVYPEELCQTPIKSGCPEFVCKKCGKAREKIMEREKAPQEVFTNKNTPDDSFTGSYVNGEMKGQGGSLQKWREEHPDKFKGYTQCSCNAGFEGGIVLDPFIGAGTTALVALKQNKRFIGFEINKTYIDIANKRIKPFLEQTRLDVIKNENNKYV